jgi:hypothetical protein
MPYKLNASLAVASVSEIYRWVNTRKEKALLRLMATVRLIRLAV